ncbi:MAG: Holliday junction branch migration protein RuvA [Deltaproteobacteria bacterium]|nr:Holliday junction branch migration protein RuvA [Deltaproteobacteria bacterium]
MIAHLRGDILEKAADYVIVSAGGVGYHVTLSQISLRSISQNSKDISLYIYTHVREDQLSLFGFTSKEEKAVFLRLLDVSGIGPKMALAILSGLTPNEIVQAVVKEDIARLNAIPGVGKKTSERIIVDLKDRFIKDFGEIGSGKEINKPLYNDALSALRNMAEKTLANIGLDKYSTVQAVIKHALKELGQKSI